MRRLDKLSDGGHLVPCPRVEGHAVPLNAVSLTVWSRQGHLICTFPPDPKMNAARKLQKQSELQGQSPDRGARARAARSSVFAVGRNCWRVERAESASFLIDGDSYFQAFRAAAINARHSIMLRTTSSQPAAPYSLSVVCIALTSVDTSTTL